MAGGLSGGFPSGAVRALGTFDVGGGEQLYVAGSFLAADELPAKRLARWDGASWSALASGFNASVSSLAVYDDGAGPALYAGGSFTGGGGVALGRIGRWDGTSWSPLGSGLDDSVYALGVYDDGGGPALYAGGYFSSAGGVPAGRIAKWDGSTWSQLASGMLNDDFVAALAVHDDGGGPDLYVGGYFVRAGGITVRHVARWDGASWSALGSGVGGSGYPPVHAFATYDDGGGAALYAGGRFTTAGGASASRIARWNGSSWAPLGSGVNDEVFALGIFDDGAGDALFVGGGFSSAGGLPAGRIARWDGAWSTLGSGLSGGLGGGRAIALSVFDDGSGSALFVGGDFQFAGGAPAPYLARWDGSAWHSFGAGFSNAVNAFAIDPGNSAAAPALWVAGNFTDSPTGDSYFALFGCASEPGAPYCAGDGSASPCPCGNEGHAGAGCANSTGAGAVLSASGTASVVADDLALHCEGLPPGQPALLFVALERVQGGSGMPLGDGLRCAAGGVQRLGVAVPGASGVLTWGPGLAAQGGWRAGDLRRFQVYYRDSSTSPCGSRVNLSNGYELTFSE